MDKSAIRSDSLQLQDRDISLLCGLFESRVMTAGHVATLYFNGKREYTKKRLQRLKAAGLISERKRLPTQPSVLFLTRKAFSLLSGEGQLSQFPVLGPNSFEARAKVSERTLRHEIEVMDVKAAFHAALAKSEKFSIVKFSTWPLLHEFRAARPGQGGKEVTIRPDGFICIHEKEEGSKGFNYECFFELDRSNEVQDALVAKAACYRDFYQSGGFAVRNAATRADYESFPFRVLLVLKSAERRNNTAERLAQSIPRILTQAWLTTFAEVTADPLGAIWITPGEYRKVTQETSFDGESSNPILPYIRRPGREVFVEANIRKRRFFEN
jgi:Replication-relaxation